MSVLVVAFISCRFYCRTILTKTLGWDDGVMLMAAVSSTTRSNRSKNILIEHLDYGGGKQHYDHYFHATAVPNGLSPMYADVFGGDTYRY